MAGLIRAERMTAGLQQAELAARIGRDQSVVSNIERGQWKVDIVQFVDLAKAFGLEPETLFHRLMMHWPATVR